jgi:hypothetical protein
VPADRDGGEHEGEEADDRDVKKDIHACFKKNNKVRVSVQLIPSLQVFRWLAEGMCVSV